MIGRRILIVRLGGTLLRVHWCLSGISHAWAPESLRSSLYCMLASQPQVSVGAHGLLAHTCFQAFLSGWAPPCCAL